MYFGHMILILCIHVQSGQLWNLDINLDINLDMETSGFYGLTHTPLFENARLEDEISDRMQDG